MEAPAATGADPRITRAGRFLRRTSLDELPQLWSVAEWCLGAMLHFYRDFDHYARAASEGRWERRWARELSGTTLVVIGAGAAGSELARMASALGMRTVGVTLYGPVLHKFDKLYPPEKMEEAIPQGDVTVVLLPLYEDTEGCFGAGRIGALIEVLDPYVYEAGLLGGR